MYKLIIFDLDGTLLNTIEDLANACNYALRECNLKEHELHKFNKFVGDGKLKLIERIIPEEFKEDKVLFEKMVKLFDEYYLNHMIDMTKPYEGVKEMLTELKTKGIKLGVLSNKPHEFTVDIVEKFFGGVFDSVLGHRKGHNTKPDPSGIIEIIDEYRVLKEETLFIGDSDVDIKTAQNAKVTSVGVSWGFRGEEELREIGADIIVRSAKEIISL